jgi:cyclic pyranopterin phosphate synthase
VSFTLRVNVGEQCQLDCGYCRPSLAPVTVARERLTAAHYGWLAEALAGLPLGKVRFTGGEPLLRDDLVDIVYAFRRALPQVSLAVTTNGAMLPAQLTRLTRAGLDAATVHLDSLWPERYRALMGGGQLSFALRGVAEAKAQLKQVKVNVVLQRGRNDDELDDFLDWSAREGVEVRFIELMNTGSACEYTRAHFVAGAEVVQRLKAEPVPRRSAHDPAALYRARGVVFGVIASDTAPFCAACDRLRLSPSGLLRGCLYAPPGLDVGAMLRGGASLSQLRSALRVALAEKQSHHPSQALARAPFSMAAVGG